jgi:hypothetical protein
MVGGYMQAGDVTDYFEGVASLPWEIQNFAARVLMLWKRCGMLELVVKSGYRLMVDKHGRLRNELIVRRRWLGLEHLAGDLTEEAVLKCRDVLDSQIRELTPFSNADQQKLELVDLRQLESEADGFRQFGPFVTVPVFEPVASVLWRNCDRSSPEQLALDRTIAKALARSNYKMKLVGLEVRFNVELTRLFAGQLLLLVSEEFLTDLETRFRNRLLQCSTDITVNMSELVDEKNINTRSFITGRARRSAHEYWAESVAAFSLKKSREELQWLDCDMHACILDFVRHPESYLSPERKLLLAAIRKKRRINCTRIEQFFESEDRE